MDTKIINYTYKRDWIIGIRSMKEHWILTKVTPGSGKIRSAR